MNNYKIVKVEGIINNDIYEVINFGSTLSDSKVLYRGPIEKCASYVYLKTNNFLEDEDIKEEI